MSLPLDMWSSKNISGDIFHGCFVVTCTLFAFIGLIWLREQILHGGGPDWLERDEPNNQQQLNVLLPPIPEENPVDEVSNTSCGKYPKQLFIKIILNRLKENFVKKMEIK